MTELLWLYDGGTAKKHDAIDLTAGASVPNHRWSKYG